MNPIKTVTPVTPIKSLLMQRLRGGFLRTQALALPALGRLHAALACFEQLLRRQPLDRHALASRAHILAQLNRFPEAVLNLRVLVEALPQSANGWFNLGFALQQLGQQAEAVTAFRSALAIDPCLDRAWYGLALVLMDLRQFQAAKVALKNATSLQPMSPHGWFCLAQVREALGQHDEALKIIGHLRGFEPRVAAQLELTLDRGVLTTTALNSVISPGHVHGQQTGLPCSLTSNIAATGARTVSLLRYC